MRLLYTEDLYFLLAKVDRQIVLLHDSCETCVPGFSWDGSAMSQDAQEAMNNFRHAGLLEVGQHWPWGAAVSLSDTGVARLAEWREQRALGLRGVA